LQLEEHSQGETINAWRREDGRLSLSIACITFRCQITFEMLFRSQTRSAMGVVWAVLGKNITVFNIHTQVAFRYTYTKHTDTQLISCHLYTYPNTRKLMDTILSCKSFIFSKMASFTHSFLIHRLSQKLCSWTSLAITYTHVAHGMKWGLYKSVE